MDNISNDVNKMRLYRGIGVFVILALIAIDLPYSDKSIAQIIFPSIKFGQTTIYLSGLPILVGYIWSFIDIIKSNMFKASRVIIFIIMFMFILPMFNSLLESSRDMYYSINSGVKAIEVLDSRMMIYEDGDGIYLSAEVVIKSHRLIKEPFDIGMIIPDVANIEGNYYLVGNMFSIGKRQEVIFSEDILIYDKSNSGEFLVDNEFFEFYDSDYTIVISSDDEVMEVIMGNTY